MHHVTAGLWYSSKIWSPMHYIIIPRAYIWISCIHHIDRGFFLKKNPEIINIFNKTAMNREYFHKTILSVTMHVTELSVPMPQSSQSKLFHLEYNISSLSYRISHPLHSIHPQKLFYKLPLSSPLEVSSWQDSPFHDFKRNISPHSL